MASPLISLRTSDNVLIKTNIETARGSIKILSMLEDNGYEEGNEATLQLPEVNSVILEKILEWTSFHKVFDTNYSILSYIWNHSL